MMTGRAGAGPLRGISALLLLRAVPAAGLLAVLDALSVERTADDLVPNAGEVLHTTAADEHDRVLLQVVADARDVSRDLDAAREPDAGDLAQRGVRLLRRRGVHAGAHASTLRRTLERRRLGLADLVLATLADQLIDRRHAACRSFPGSLLRPRSVVVLLPYAVGRRRRTPTSPLCSCLPTLRRTPPVPGVGRVALAPRSSSAIYSPHQDGWVVRRSGGHESARIAPGTSGNLTRSSCADAKSPLGRAAEAPVRGS